MRHEIKVVFENEDFFYTKANGSIEEIKKYYIGKVFNMGTITDNLKKCVRVEFI